MSRIHICEVNNFEGNSVELAGFVHANRVMKGRIFTILRDKSGTIQLYFDEAVNKELFDLASSLTLESVISVVGKIQEKPSRGDAKEYEMVVEKIDILSTAEELPIPVNAKADNEADTDKRFDYRWLDLRAPERAKIFSVWTELEKGFRSAYEKMDFTQIYTPAFMGTASETGSEVFEVKYFDRKAYLAQSPQFYKQMAMASGMERVYVMGPVFRAEKSNTVRHTTEFTSWDFEQSYIDSELDVMSTTEDIIISGFEAVKKAGIVDIEVPAKPFPAIKFADVKEKLKSTGIKSEHVDDFSPEEEKALSEIILKETGHDFVFVTDYETSIRPFYHMRNAEGKTKSFDLFYRGVEIVTGAQREHRVDILEAQAREKEMDLAELKDYIDFFRYGCPPHGGIGMGPARLVMKMMGLANVKEAVFLPRDVRRLRP